MKTLIFTIIALASVSLAAANPFVITDPVPVDILECIFNLDGNEVVVPAEPDNSCKLDLAGITVGNHSITVEARNLWGQSSGGTPFLFVKELPPSPTGTALSEN